MHLPKASPEYSDLKLLTEARGIIYGPIQSRRVGTSLGINLLGADQKACSFNCVYCELGPTEVKMNQVKKDLTFPTPEEIDQALRETLKSTLESGQKIDSLSLSGNGEAMLHPQFPEVVDLLVSARNDIASQSKIVLFTNGTQLDQRKNLNCLSKLDQIMVKLDAGNDEVLKTINQPLLRTNVSKQISHIKKIEKYTIQSCFVQGSVDNTTSDNIEEWVEVIGMLDPEEIHVYTLDRVPSHSGLIKVDEDTLDIIAQKAAKRTNAKVLTF